MAIVLKKLLPWQLSPLQLICSQAFCIGAALILYISIANALFIDIYGVSYLPFIFIISAGFIPIFAFGFNRLTKTLSTGRLIQFVSLLSIAVFFISWLLNLLFAWDWIALAMMVSFFFVTSYLLRVQGIEASQFFDVRQMKMRSATILTASMAGVILFGLSARIWSTVFGNQIHLILLATILLGVMYMLVDLALVQHPELLCLL